ncbi:hypothetical protein ACQPYE_40180 [Actinosynnema sp. CA-299493]
MNRVLVQPAIVLACAALLTLSACTAGEPQPFGTTDQAPASTTATTGTTTTESSATTSRTTPTTTSTSVLTEVEVAGEMTITGDEVTWVDSLLDASDQQHLRVVPRAGAQPRTASLAPDATFLTPGVGTPRVTPDGLGAAPTSRQEFLALPDASRFAPKLFLDGGEIVRIATRYRP